MKRIIIICLMLAFTLAPYAQQNRNRKQAAKKTVVKKRKTTTNRKTTKKTTVKTPTVQALQNQRQQIQQQIKEQEKRLRTNQVDVKKRLQSLMVINNEIADKRRTIDTIRRNIDTIDVAIERLCVQLDDLQEELNKCKQRYIKSMRYLHRNRSDQSQLMFIFSADNLSQMFRRIRFMREYAAYQHVQGDKVKAQQESVDQKLQEISLARRQKTTLLARDEQERRSLEGKQEEQQNVVKSLQREQKTIQGIIAQQKKKDAALNAQIDRLIAEEVARQKARAAAEAKRRAEAEAAKKRAAELARKKAEEARKRAEQEALAAKTKEAREEARRRARELAREEENARKAEESLYVPTEDMRISGSFESNRGRLPIPITGAYRIVSHFGQYNVEGLKNVTLDNKGINIRGEAGAQARSIFDGEVSGVFSFGGTMVVMVRHGSYISVYCNLASVSVRRGQKVSTRQALGRIGQDNILQFQLRRETAKLNPESWLGR
ncbi:MAG: peptidoglycan DD-metalloendopeptidase family protein [Prevotella sp.]|nr:peptidoglycan DD-metalloendopeptidase family protein [Prevotella sp.]